MRTRSAAIAAGLIMLFTSACAGAETRESAITDGMTTVELVEHLRTNIHYKYIPYTSPREMLEHVDMAIVGTVVSVDTAMLAEPFDGEAVVVVALKVEEGWKTAKEGDISYWMFSRPKDFDTQKYRDGLPEGLTVVLFGNATPSDAKFSEGTPPAGTYQASPQGLFLAVDGEHLTNVWADPTANVGWPPLTTVSDIRAAIQS